MSEPRKNKAPSAQPPTVLRDERVGTAGFEFNSPHAGLLFYRHLRASQRPYWQLWATMDRQTLRQASNRRIPASPARQRRLRTDPQDDVERQVRVLCLDSRLQLFGCRGARKRLIERREVLLREGDARRRGPLRRLLMAGDDESGIERRDTIERRCPARARRRIGLRGPDVH